MSSAVRTQRTPVWSRFSIGSFLVPILLAVSGASMQLQAQDVYVVSWDVQAPKSGLVQDIAARTIDLLNDFTTRDDPNAATARLDDRLRITLIGRLDPQDGTVREEIVEVRAGAIVLGDELVSSLPKTLIDSLAARDYLWENQHMDVVDIDRLPDHARLFFESRTRGRSPTGDDMSSPVSPCDRLVRFAIDNDHSLVLDVGFDAVLLPGFSTGRISLGYEGSSVALTVSAPVPLDAGTSITGDFHDDYSVDGTLHVGPVTSHVSIALRSIGKPLGPSVRLSGLASTSVDIVPLAQEVGDYRLRTILGGSVVQTVELGSLPSSEVTSLHPRLLLAGSIERLRADGYPFLEQFGVSTSLSGVMVQSRLRIAPSFGVKAAFALNDLLLDPIPGFTSTSFWIGPTIRW